MESHIPLKIEFLVVDDPVFGGMRPHAGASSISGAELSARVGMEPAVSDAFFPGDERAGEVWPCRLGGGFAFGIRRALEGDAAGHVEIWTCCADQVPIVALALGLPDGWFEWQSGLGPAVERPWCVVRQDDNGNRFELARFAGELDAALYARLWDERVGSHKQTVFIVKGDGGGHGI